MCKEKKVQQRAKQVTFEDVTDEVKALLGLKLRYGLLLADVCIQKRYAKVLNPGTCGLGLCWNWGLCRHNQIKISSQWSKVVPNPMSGGQRGKLQHRHTLERQPRKGRGGDWSYPFTGQRTPRTADNFQMTGGRHEDSSLDPSERTWSCKHLYFGLLDTRTERLNSYCLRPLYSILL